MGLPGVVLVAALLLVTTGCEVGTDDEMAPAPTKTITATPSQSVAPAPATIPVGTAKISPTDSVWADGSVLHVGRQQVDLSPIEIEAFLVVPGGVFLLSQGELWFTDLTKVKGTGQTDVTGVRTNAAGTVLVVVDTRSGRAAVAGLRHRDRQGDPGTGRHPDPEEMRDGPGRRSTLPFACRADGPSAGGSMTRPRWAPVCCVGETERWCAARRPPRPAAPSARCPATPRTVVFGTGK